MKIKYMRLFTVIILKNYIIRFDDENGLNLFLFIDDYFKWIKIIIRICIRIFSLFYRFDVEALNNDLSNDIQIENSVKKKELLIPIGTTLVRNSVVFIRCEILFSK